MFSADTCSKPTITDGTVDPDDATVRVTETYTVTCDTDFTISGTDTMTCGSDGTFDETPTCEGLHIIVLLITYLSFLAFLINL